MGATRLLEVTFEGWQFTEDDLALLREAFEPVTNVRVTGGWQPAAIPAATVEVILTFVGQTVATVVAERLLEAAWREISVAFRRYREQRVVRGLEEPMLAFIKVRPEEIDFEITGVLAPDDTRVLDVLRLFVERRECGRLRDVPIRRVILPSKCYDGEWATLHVEEYAEPDRVDYTVWKIESGLAEPELGFYDALNDLWLPDARI